MADSQLGIVMEIVNVLIDSTVGGFFRIMGLFGELLGSVGIATEVGGPLGFAVSVILIAVVAFFLVRVFLGSGKRMAILVLVGIILSYVILLGALLQ